MEAIKENWTTIKEAVRREYSLSDISYHTWVEPLEFHNVVNDVVSIIIPSDQAQWLLQTRSTVLIMKMPI